MHGLPQIQVESVDGDAVVVGVALLQVAPLLALAFQICQVEIVDDAVEVEVAG